MSRTGYSLLSGIHARLSSDSNRLALGIGATVPLSYARAKTRVLFFEALHRLMPRITTDLITHDGCEIMRQCALAWDRCQADEDSYQQDRIGATTRDQALAVLDRYLCSTATRALLEWEERRDTYIQSWQRRFHLTDAWVAEAALVTLFIAQKEREAGRCYDGPLLLPYETLTTTVHEGKPWPPNSIESDLCTSEPDRLLRVPIYLDELKLPDTLSGWDGPLGFFDPRTETIDDAVEHLLPALESRLRMHLNVLVLADMRTSGAILTHHYRKDKKFEWLVRYQVLGESRNGIAKADGLDRAHVTKEVNETARLIGLTLRKEKGGRPRRGRRSRTIRVG